MNGDGKNLLQHGDDNDGKDLQKAADKSVDKDLNDGKDDLQNADCSDDKDLNDGKDDLQNADCMNDGNGDSEDSDYTDEDDSEDSDYADEDDSEDSSYTDEDDSEDSDYTDEEADVGAYAMFEQTYRCYPMSQIDQAHLEYGDKVLMPASALNRLAYLEIDFPILFKLNNLSSGKVTHCGVQEFTADEGTILLPAWMMEVMAIEEGDGVLVKYTSLSKGTYVKLQPHTSNFLDISNPRAVLERALRSYSCLTSGGTVVFSYNDKKYYLDIVETKPSNAVCIIETDCEVEFAPPLDYKEPEKLVPEVVKEADEVGPFTGQGRRLDGKPSTQVVSSPALKQPQPSNGSGSATAKHKSGRLVFGSNANDSGQEIQKVPSKEKAQDSAQKKEDSAQKKEEKEFKAFTGKKYLLNDNAC